MKTITTTKIRTLLFIVAFSLIFTFILHDVIPHNHPAEIYGTRIQTVFHGNDRKWWYLLLVAWLGWPSWAKYQKLDLINYTKKFVFSFSRFHIDVGKLFNPILQALRRGILNPKLYD